MKHLIVHVPVFQFFLHWLFCLKNTFVNICLSISENLVNNTDVSVSETRKLLMKESKRRVRKK